MKKSWLILVAPFALIAQISYPQLQEMLAAGTDELGVRQEISDEGLEFQIDRNVLKRMKKDGFPDWLIDYLVLRDHEYHHPEAYETAGRPYRYYGGYGGYPYYDIGPYSWWNYALAGPFYAGLWNPYYWGYYPIYGGGYGPVFHLPGNRLSPHRYRNSVDDRVVGRARPKGNSPKATSSRSRSGSTRASGSSRSGSSGGTVNRSGYHKDRN